MPEKYDHDLIVIDWLIESIYEVRNDVDKTSKVSNQK